MITRIFFAIGIIALILLFPIQALTNSKGAPASRTGAPGNDTCAASGCHDDFQADSGSGSVTITTPATFKPGDKVEFTVRVAQGSASRFGFQATVRALNDSRFYGSIELVQGTEFSDAIGRYITHSQAADADGVAEWTFQWQSPEEDIGNVVIYAAGVASNGNGNRTGDRVYTANAMLPIQVSVEDEATPGAFTLHQAYPNPFHHQTTIAFSLEHPEPVKVALYDALGRIVKSIDEGVRTAGAHEILIDANDLPAGTYYYEIQTPTARKTSSLIRLR